MAILRQFKNWSVQKTDGEIILVHDHSGYWSTVNLEPNYTLLRHVASKGWKDFDMLDWLKAWCFAVQQHKGKLPKYVTAFYMAEQIGDAIEDYEEQLLYKEWRATKPKQKIRLRYLADIDVERKEFAAWRLKHDITYNAIVQSMEAHD